MHVMCLTCCKRSVQIGYYCSLRISATYPIACRDRMSDERNRGWMFMFERVFQNRNPGGLTRIFLVPPVHGVNSPLVQPGTLSVLSYPDVHLCTLVPFPNSHSSPPSTVLPCVCQDSHTMRKKLGCVLDLFQTLQFQCNPSLTLRQGHCFPRSAFERQLLIVLTAQCRCQTVSLPPSLVTSETSLILFGQREDDNN